MNNNALNNRLLRPISALLALAGVFFIWSRVVAGHVPSHGLLALLMIAMALCVVHAVGWQCRGIIERLIFRPPLPWILWIGSAIAIA